MSMIGCNSERILNLKNFENVNKTGVKTYLKKRKNFLKKVLDECFWVW